MAERLVFLPINNSPFYNEETINFEYFSGFAISQKQKSIKSLHGNILLKHPEAKILEVSTKSTDAIGIKLSAFNLSFYNDTTNKTCPVENVFQASKVFNNGGPFLDILDKSPKDAKRDSRLKESGDLIRFQYNREQWDLNPKTMFYDWVYITALTQNPELCEEVIKYDCFTDIEFNHKKSINCQARAVAIYVGLKNINALDVLNDRSEFSKIYQSDQIAEQISFI